MVGRHAEGPNQMCGQLRVCGFHGGVAFGVKFIRIGASKHQGIEQTGRGMACHFQQKGPIIRNINVQMEQRIV